MYKFLHLIGGTTFLGIIIASFYYIASSYYKNDRELFNYTVKTSYVGDILILCIMIFQFISASMLVTSGHFTLQIPWIKIAYIAFSSVIILWILNVILKLTYFNLTSVIPNYIMKVFFAINTLIILIFVVIVHDAVTQSTWFDFVFRS